MPNHDIAVSVRDLSKSYTIAHEDQKHTLATEALLHSLKNIGKKPSTETFWALKDVSFDIQKGDVVGIIGRNGAGKSTLLKVLSRITEPTSGQIDLYGRVGSLLEVGTGFHPELTGRENTYLNGAILGMSKREIAKHFDAIVDFSGVEKFLDTPVKRYSSGMYVRLAFAVAAHLEPEILIVDEVLAVGDAEFQKKCLGKMQDVANHGRTVLFVSHNMGAVKNLCKHVAFLKQGRLAKFGKTDQIITDYLTEDAVFTGSWSRQEPIPEQRGVFLEEVSLANSMHLVTGNIASHEDFFVRLKVYATETVEDIQIAVRLTNQDGVPIFTTANTDEVSRYPTIRRGTHEYQVKVPGSFLVPGSYNILAATLTPGNTLFDVVEDKMAFVIEDTGTHATSLRDGRLGLVTPLMHWNEQVENATTYETALVR